MNYLIELIEHLHSLTSEGRKTSSDDAFKIAFQTDGSGEALKQCAALFSLAAEEVNAVGFRKGGTSAEYIAFLSDLEKSLLSRALARGPTARGNLVEPTELARLVGIEAHVSELLDRDGGSLNRDELSSSISKLMNEISSSDLQPYAKTTLLLQMTSIRSILDAAVIVTDDDLRRRVKAVLADFAIEFDLADQRYRGWFEKLMAWSKPFAKGGRKAITTASDIARLLPPPS